MVIATDEETTTTHDDITNLIKLFPARIFTLCTGNHKGLFSCMVSFDCPEKRLKDAVLSEAFSKPQDYSKQCYEICLTVSR
jgi:hypothetical protein